MYTELLRMLRNVHVNFWQLLVSPKKWKLMLVVVFNGELWLN